MKDLFKELEDLRGINPCGIYCLTINNKNYIGSSKNIKKRLRRHRTLLRNNLHDNKYLQNLYNKYKSCEYKIIEEFDKNITTKELRVKEKEYIQLTNDTVNFGDPVLGIGGYHEKPVYQYSVEGTLIKKWQSAIIASRNLNIPYAGIHSCANPNVVKHKSSSGFIWSYIKLDNIEYINNTGSNLEKKSVTLYYLDGSFYRTFKSLSDSARYIAKIIDYEYDWKHLRSTIFYAIKSPKTRKVRGLYIASYKCVSNILNESI